MADDAVCVAVKIRPLVASEVDDGCRESLFVTPGVPQVSTGQHTFTYDHVFGEGGTVPDLLYRKCVAPLVGGLFKGYNATVFAYGQTGSGKTYTMGSEYRAHGRCQGVIPDAINDIFSRIEAAKDSCITVRVSFVEIHKEEVKDLLLPASTGPRPAITIRETQSGGVALYGAVEKEVRCREEMADVLEVGTLCRSTASTSMNNRSSRSHAIFSITLEQRRQVQLQAGTPSANGDAASTPGGGDDEGDEDDEAGGEEAEGLEDYLCAKMHMVDLAGSERAKRTKAEGARLREGIHINRGLLALGNVINAIVDNHKHVPYRDSKLTRLLQDSLGGNSRTTMIACASPADCNFEESLNTLRYADRARHIRNKPVINRDPVAAQLALLRGSVAQLRSENASLKRALAASGNEGALAELLAGGGGDGGLGRGALEGMVERLTRDNNSLDSDNLRLKMEMAAAGAGLPLGPEAREKLLARKKELEDNVSYHNAQISELQASWERQKAEEESRGGGAMDVRRWAGLRNVVECRELLRTLFRLNVESKWEELRHELASVTDRWHTAQAQCDLLRMNQAAAAGLQAQGGDGGAQGEAIAAALSGALPLPGLDIVKGYVARIADLEAELKSAKSLAMLSFARRRAHGPEPRTPGGYSPGDLDGLDGAAGDGEEDGEGEGELRPELAVEEDLFMAEELEETKSRRVAGNSSAASQQQAAAAAAQQHALGGNVEIQPNVQAPLLRTDKDRREWLQRELELCNMSCEFRKVIDGELAERAEASRKLKEALKGQVIDGQRWAAGSKNRAALINDYRRLLGLAPQPPPAAAATRAAALGRGSGGGNSGGGSGNEVSAGGAVPPSSLHMPMSPVAEPAGEGFTFSPHVTGNSPLAAGEAASPGPTPSSRRPPNGGLGPWARSSLNVQAPPVRHPTAWASTLRSSSNFPASSSDAAAAAEGAAAGGLARAGSLVAATAGAAAFLPRSIPAFSPSPTGGGGSSRRAHVWGDASGIPQLPLHAMAAAGGGGGEGALRESLDYRGAVLSPPQPSCSPRLQRPPSHTAATGATSPHSPHPLGAGTPNRQPSASYSPRYSAGGSGSKLSGGGGAWLAGSRDRGLRGDGGENMQPGVSPRSPLGMGGGSGGGGGATPGSGGKGTPMTNLYKEKAAAARERAAALRASMQRGSEQAGQAQQEAGGGGGREAGQDPGALLSSSMDVGDGRGLSGEAGRGAGLRDSGAQLLGGSSKQKAIWR
ncbi:Chromosome-associated kinesin KIF4 [Tetrabaena socialis]|uniref:Chromosome-associated kinesin KIF4 n=1 Tax=Tetrabaena socialis TaxID=47790 RepID=A0A2J8AH31_9CHLO|nr:Chromosome-associated kinesin KIF4 [Tetrabaena socialis]|eukprot:PNH11829.1 Chromosome-associated kinesin KIF4 [Tetrabaena socialis]